MISENSKSAARKVIHIYRNIPLEKIKKYWDTNGGITAKKLTGFSDRNTCLLCMAVKNKCSECIYQTPYGCCGINHITSYVLMYLAKTSEELKVAMLKRADHIERLL
jgi:hypothetical protein